MDFRQTRAWSSYMSSCGWKRVKFTKTSFGYIYHVPLMGSVIRIPRIALPIPFTAIDRMATQTSATLVKLEPDAPTDNAHLRNDLARHGYHADHWSIEPTATRIIDLTHTETLLFDTCKPKWRQYIRYGKRHGVTVTQSDDIETFSRLWHQNSRRKKFRIESHSQLTTLWHAFRKERSAHLLVAEVGAVPVAGALLLGNGTTMTLYHLAYSGLSQTYRPLYRLVWESILSAKQKGYRLFDFDGIADTRFPYTDALQPTFFKHGFGGTERFFIGSFVKYYRPVLSLPYRAISLLKPEVFFPLYRIMTSL